MRRTILNSLSTPDKTGTGSEHVQQGRGRMKVREVSVPVLSATLILLMLATTNALGQQVPTDPASTHIFPAGGQRGTTVPVRVGGECISPYTRFILLGSGVAAEPELIEKVQGRYEPSPRRKPNETPIYYPREWKSSIAIAQDAPLGQTLWRTSSARGGTGARPFLVGDLPEFIETESNSTPEAAEAIKLPVTVNGQIAGERDLDYFSFKAQEGDVVTADVAVARLGSTLEPVVEFYDSRGQRLVAEELRVGSDPVMALKIPATGRYQILISNLNYRGGPQFVYRMTLTTEPYVKYAFPPGGMAGSTSEVRFVALTGDGRSRAWIENVSFPPAGQAEFEFASKTLTANRVLLESSDVPVMTENEPNDTLPTATSAGHYTKIYGRFESSTDTDFYAGDFAKDQAVTIECDPVSLSSGLLPVLTLYQADGTQLSAVSAAERTPRTCRMEWIAPQAGTFIIAVRDLQQGASNYSDAPYRLTIQPTESDFAITATTDVVNVIQGERGEIELKIDRRGGFASPIDLSTEGLPAGVRFEPPQIPAGVDVVRLAFVAEADIPPGDSFLSIQATSKIGERVISKSVQAAHLGRDAEGVSLGSPTVDRIQLTVRHKPVFRLYCNEAYQYAYRGTVYPYLMEVERIDGFDGPIHLEVADRQIKDLDGVEVIESTFPAGKSQLMLPLYLPENMHINVQAHSNIYSQGYVVFQDKWGQRQSMTQISEMRCMIRPLPTVAKLRAMEKSIARKPGVHSVTFKLDRTSNFTGDMNIELHSPPVGVTMPTARLPAGETTITAMVTIADQVLISDIHQITFRGKGDMSSDVQVISETVLAINP